MPRQSKGPRLYLRKGRVDHRSGKKLADIWFIRDGAVEISTGCGVACLSGTDGAEAKLANYLADKWSREPEVNPSSDPARILIADVLAHYIRGRAPKLASPKDTAVRVKALLGWWGDKYLSSVKLSTSEAYVQYRTLQPLKQARHADALKKRVTEAGARRELEDLSAAIHYWAKEYPLLLRPTVALPPKPDSPRDALSRHQAARLLKASLGYRWCAQQQCWHRLSLSARSNRAHVRRFLLIQFYTGTRPGVVPKLLWHESPAQAWVDLEAGMIYRRGKTERDKPTKKRPVVRLPRRLVAHLRRWRGMDLAAPLCVQSDPSARCIAPSTVIHHGGKPMAGRLRRSFEACVADAGLPEEITPHWLRHTCVTWLMEANVDVWRVAAYTGMTVQTLEKHYAHHRPDYQEAASSALGGGGGKPSRS